MRFLRQNTGLKVLSLALAVVLWGIVRITGTPTGETPAQRVYTVPIRFTNPAKPDLVAEPALKEVTLTLRGKRNVIDRVRPALIQADVDLTDRGPGNYVERVNILAPGGAEVVDADPTQIGVKISRRSMSQVPVRIRPDGKAAPGYQVGEPGVEPATVRVYGPEDDVEQVVAVTGRVPVTDRRRSLTTDIARDALQPVNASGVVVSGVRIQEESVAVTVPVQFESVTYEVPVLPTHVRATAPRGFILQVDIAPKFVTLQGPAGLQPPEQVATTEVSFGNVQAPQTKEAAVEVPEGFRIVGPSVVQVTVNSRRASGAAATPAETGQAR